MNDLSEYQAQTFRLRPELRLNTVEQAIAFVNQRGFIYFWPISGILFPSLWAAVAGNRPVADKHDDPGHITWRWKDNLLGQRKWYYAKILRGKATLISLDLLPYFYALSENFGDPEQDYLQLYQEGLLSREARLIYEALLREGPLDTVTLRRAVPTSSASPFERALTQLQRDFKILPVGVAASGPWRYSFIYEPVHRHYPHLIEQSKAIGRPEARQKLLLTYFMALGEGDPAGANKLFQWKPTDLNQTIAELVPAGQLHQTANRLTLPPPKPQP